MIRSSAKIRSICTCPVFRALKSSAWLSKLVGGHGKDGRTSNIKRERTSPSGPVVSFMLLTVSRWTCVSSSRRSSSDVRLKIERRE